MTVQILENRRKMAVGAVIENLSTRKLTAFSFLLAAILVLFIIIGGFVAPKPSMAVHVIAKNCFDHLTTPNKTKLYLPETCSNVESLGEHDTAEVEADEIIFSAVFPQKPQEMIPWFQYLLVVFHLSIAYQPNNPKEDGSSLTLDVTLAYSDHPKARSNINVWKTFSSCREVRKLECSLEADAEAGTHYDCEPMHLFQLGSLPHKFYLVNIRMPTKSETGVSLNHGIGSVEEMAVIGISQTGGFTQVWLSLKSVVAFLMFFPIFWFWQRIRQLERKPQLIEKAIMLLGVSMWFLDLPFEFISLFLEAPWMLFFIDIRQGFFYTVLLSFWIIFIGEHLMDQAHRNKLSNYKFQLSAICIGSTALLAFDVAERGYQMVSPCSTIWTTPNFANSLLYTAIVMGVLYFMLLLYLVFRVFRSIRYKSRFGQNPQQQSQFRKTVNRFRALMVLTVATAALTVAFYNISQSYDGAMHWGDKAVEVNSAFFTGVYGLWNIYVFLVLSMYAPSHKEYSDPDNDNRMDSRQELIQLTVTEQQQLLEVTQEKTNED